MPKIKSIKYIGNEDVYNMKVEKHHNFAVNGGLIVHNCDALRYFCIMRQCPTVEPKERRDDFFDREKEDSFELHNSYIDMNIRGR